MSTHIEYDQLVRSKDRWKHFLVLRSWNRAEDLLTFNVTWARTLVMYTIFALSSHGVESKILNTFLVRSGSLSQDEMSRVFGLRLPIPFHANFQSRSPKVSVCSDNLDFFIQWRCTFIICSSGSLFSKQFTNPFPVTTPSHLSLKQMRERKIAASSRCSPVLHWLLPANTALSPLRI